MYTITEIIQKLNNDDLKINHLNHKLARTNKNFILDMLKYKLEFNLRLIDEFKDNEKTCKLYKSYLNQKIPIKIPFRDANPFLTLPELVCFSCGNSHDLILLDEKTIGFSHINFKNLTAKLNFKECSFPYEKSKNLFQGNLNIPSGKLLIANYISANNNNEYYDPIYNPKEFPSIDYIKGQYDLNQHLLNKNIFYGQTGNTGGDVLYSKDKNEILFTSSLYSDENSTDPEIVKTFENKGYISMDVWRYMITDYQQAIDNNYDISDEHIVINIPSGNYNVKHLYNINNENNFFKMKKIS